MQKKIKGILLFKKIHKENDLYIKILSDTDELISGIVYGGLSKKKRNIFQNGFFLSFVINYILNKPPSISAELTQPYISSILNNKYKLNCLLSIISLLNTAIIEGQKINNIFSFTKDFLNFMIVNDKWLIEYIKYLFNLLKIIGYDIDHNSLLNNSYFDTKTLEFKKTYSESCIFFSHELLNNKIITKSNFNEVSNFLRIFEIVFEKNHLSNFNLQLPNQYQLFKKLIIDNIGR